MVLSARFPDRKECKLQTVSTCTTRSSAVAVIADRTVYDARYTGKLSKRFRLQVYERLVRMPRSDSTGRVYERT